MCINIIDKHYYFFFYITFIVARSSCILLWKMYFHNKIQLFFCSILFDNVFAKNLWQLIHARIKKSYLFLSAWNQKLIQEKWAVGHFLLCKKYFTPWLQDKKKIFFFPSYCAVTMVTLPGAERSFSSWLIRNCLFLRTQLQWKENFSTI